MKVKGSLFRKKEKRMCGGHMYENVIMKTIVVNN